jgi:arylsulfatase A-like enzyme
VILADDLGWADVGWRGSEIRTPSLDKLAAEGMRLEQFYVLPMCTPTRASLLTGRYPIRYGLQMGVVVMHSDYGLSSDERTLATALREAGYYTAICGKWHLGHAKKEFLPNQHGFDHHYGFYLGMTDYYTHAHGGGFDWHRNGKTLREEGYATDLIAEESIRLIRQHDMKQPFFLYVPFNAVHSPYQETPHKEINELYANMTVNNNTRRIYAGMLTAMDAAIGRILKAVEEKGVKDNTIVFFCSDNGGPAPGRITDNGPLRAGKTTAYEGGVRVPASITWPAKIKAGTVANSPMHIVDLYPTLLNIVGASLKQKHPIDGQDLRSILLEGKTNVPEREILLSATPYTGALRKGDWKIVLNGSLGFSSGPNNRLLSNKANKPDIELFNLANDLGEKNDLSASQPEKVKELLDRYWFYAEQAVPPLNNRRPADFQAPDVWGEFD